MRTASSRHTINSLVHTDNTKMKLVQPPNVSALYDINFLCECNNRTLLEIDRSLFSSRMTSITLVRSFWHDWIIVEFMRGKIAYSWTASGYFGGPSEEFVNLSFSKSKVSRRDRRSGQAHTVHYALHAHCICPKFIRRISSWLARIFR